MQRKNANRNKSASVTPQSRIVFNKKQKLKTKEVSSEHETKVKEAENLNRHT